MSADAFSDSRNFMKTICIVILCSLFLLQNKSKKDNSFKLQESTKNLGTIGINQIKFHVKFKYSQEFSEGEIQIIDPKNKIILKDSDYYSNEEFKSFDIKRINSYIKDINLDGYKDFCIPNKTNSGSAGYFENVYLFNNLTKKFEHSKELSGYNIILDIPNRIVKGSAKNGYSNRIKSLAYLDKNGKIKFSEVYNSEPTKDGNYSVTYKKIVRGKVLKTRKYIIDEIEFNEKWNNSN